jgi:transaldolase / glucose-6-phosphate isomerase
VADTKNALHQMLEQGTSPWIDNITRDMLQDGTLKRLIDDGVVGLTSNPTIFQKAISGSQAYADALRALAREDKNASQIFDTLVLDDIGNAADALRPVYDRANGGDGFVSIEVSPDLAHDEQRTLEEARRLSGHLNRPNVMVKIPGTPEGIPAFQQAIAEGININVTLLFSLESYRDVAEAYIAGLEQHLQAGHDISHIASVASFFVSRVDTMVDKKLEDMISQTDDESRKQHLRSLEGKAAIANAKMAYEAYGEIFSGPRWQALASKGAKPQRCLWASTSTKNPSYRDVMYVEQLIGPDTVDTMPDATIKAMLDHGKVERTLDRDLDTARRDLQALEDVGISMHQVTHQLQVDGVASFADSFNDLLAAIETKRQEMLATA